MNAKNKVLSLALCMGCLAMGIAYAAEAVVLAAWCRRDGVTHLHAHFGTNAAAIAMLASRLAGIPYSFTAHGPDEFERATLLALDRKLRQAAFVRNVRDPLAIGRPHRVVPAISSHSVMPAAPRPK